MNALTKIILGALVTAAIGWWLNGSMGFGERCAAKADAAVPVAPIDANVAAAPEAPATAEAVAGCQTKVNDLMKGKTINFQTSGAVIAADSNVLLDTLATELKACTGTTVEIAGHTDARGGDAANMRLSEARASAVAEALVSRGVPTERLLPKGYGETKPLDPGASAEALAKNRRTEFTVAASAATAAPAAGQ